MREAEIAAVQAKLGEKDRQKCLLLLGLSAEDAF